MLHSQGQYRTIWLSDIHLGTRGCKAELLLDFFKHNDSDKLYFVGDIIDGWRLRRSWYWPQSHSTVIQKVLRKSRKGTEVIYIPGNHDEFLRDYEGLNFGSIIVKKQDIHVTADGKRLLVIHGDAFDAVLNYSRLIAYAGDKAYDMALAINSFVNYLRRMIGLPYWSLSAQLKHKVKQAVSIIGGFEGFLAETARKLGADGVVCGHIHHAEMRMIGDILYCNDGDWVESCTALVEHYDGRLEIINWTETDHDTVEASQRHRDHQRRLVPAD